MRFEYLIASFVLTVLLLGIGTAVAATDTVVLSSDSVADQTVADALAVKKDGVVVTTEWGNETDAAVEEAVEEIDGKKPVKIYIVGGTVAVSERIRDRLIGLGYVVIRLGGADRYETSAMVAGQWGDSEEVTVAIGLDDEGMEEARNETRNRTKANVIPVLLVKPDSVPNVIKNRIRALNAN
ncbi:MAG: cell wall-binding repeat-containing protein, partial [Thermoplasmata archaeon]|nr:cell wall-binding repeat-containing protein [Thermoplasmata archaeon]